MPIVYVVQPPREGPRGFTYDLSPALAFGTPSFVFDIGEQPSLAPFPAVAKARKALEHFTEEDFLLWAGGDPAALAICSMIAAQHTNGKVTLLRWERERDDNGNRTGRGYYVPVKVRV